MKEKKVIQSAESICTKREKFQLRVFNDGQPSSCNVLMVVDEALNQWYHK